MTETKYYKLIKLSSGETIVCGTNETLKNITRKKTITVFNPVILNTIRVPRPGGIIESFMLTPWFNVSDTEEFQIISAHIISAGDASDTMLDIYSSFLAQREQENEDDSEIKSAEELEEESNDEFDQFMQAIVEKIGEQSEEENEGREELSFGRARRNTRTLH